MDEQKVLQHIQEVLSGNQDSYKYLIDEYKDSVYNLVFKFCGNFSDAEDITSEAFVRAYKNIKSYNIERSFKNWLFSIAVNAAKDLLRKKKNIIASIDSSVFLEESEVQVQYSDESDNPETLLFNKDQAQDVLSAINALPEKYRIVIILRYMENLSYEEISNIILKPTGSVKNYIHRAQKVLSKSLESKNTSKVSKK